MVTPLVRIGIACVSVLVLAGCGGGARMIVGAKVPLAPPGTYVSDDVGAGYAAYKDVLARWGEWSPDEAYGVHWCPRPGAAFPASAPFKPYRARGHWDANENAPKYGAPPGSPFWVSDDSETWGEITMHHGWWVQVPDGDGVFDPRVSPWCWVPGLEETPARVVWRSGGGFVGWAPEPPSWIDDGDEGLYAYFDWSFVMEGGLLEDDVDDQYLDGDAQEAAANATSRHPVVQMFDPSTGRWGEEKKNATLQRFARIGPNVREVKDAKKALLAYAHTHPEVNAPAAPSTSTPNASSSSAASSSSSSSSSSSTSSKKKTTTTEVDDLPRAMAMYPIMMHEPMVGPLGLTPRFLRMPDPLVDQTKAAVSTSSSSSGGSSSSSSHASSWHAPSSSGPSSYSGSSYSTTSTAPITSTHSSSSSGTSSTHSYSSSHTSSSSSSSSSSHTAVHHK